MPIEFTLPRQIISEKLAALSIQKIKKQKIHIQRATKKKLIGIQAAVEEIQKEGIPRYLVLKKLQGKLGHGIFLHPAAKPIAKGDVIAPYSGEVFICRQNDEGTSDYVFSLLSDLLLTKEEQKLFDPKGKYHPKRLYAIDLDAQNQGNFTRFINHSDQPNIEAELLRIPTNTVGLEPAPFEMIYIAKKTIKPGEQLLVSYEGDGATYWGVLKIKPFSMSPKTFRLNASLQLK